MTVSIFITFHIQSSVCVRQLMSPDLFHGQMTLDSLASCLSVFSALLHATRATTHDCFVLQGDQGDQGPRVSHFCCGVQWCVFTGFVFLFCFLAIECPFRCFFFNIFLMLHLNFFLEGSVSSTQDEKIVSQHPLCLELL